MGKLNIAHHKSYHPYRRDNIERVRKDEQEARSNEVIQEGKMMLADAEARIGLLRQRAGLSTQATPTSPSAEDEDVSAEAGPSSLPIRGHINLFEDLERAVQVTVKPTKPAAAAPEQGIPLAPSEKDRTPWYSDRNHEKNKDIGGDRRIRELARQSAQDPLTSIKQQLASRSTSSESFRRKPTPRLRTTAAGSSRPEVSERLTRESSERQRALQLIQSRRKKLEGDQTPSTVRSVDGGYGDVFNRREVEEAHRTRDRRRHDDDRYRRSGWH